MARKNTIFKIEDVQTLACEALRNVMKENWGKAIQHVIKVEDAFWEMDFGERAPGSDVSEMIIDIHPDEDDSDKDVEILDESVE